MQELKNINKLKEELLKSIENTQNIIQFYEKELNFVQETITSNKEALRLYKAILNLLT